MRFVVAILLTALALGAQAVPPNCADAAIHCVGPGLEFDTSKGVERAFQAAADAAGPGVVIKIQGGEYRHDEATRVARELMRIEKSGTADRPIRIEPFDGEWVHLRGFGFQEGTEQPSTSNQRLIDIVGDHVQVRNLELSDSSRYGIVLGGNYGVAENLIVHDNWGDNIAILGNSGIEITGNQVREVESFRSRHGSGVALLVSNSTPRAVSNSVIERTLTYRNGFQADGQKVPPVNGDPAGGGNSDGVMSSKFCQVEAADLGMKNACPGNTVRDNIAWHNADDGFDHSIGVGSQIVDNISLFNGPEGNKGFKGLNSVAGPIDWVGNTAIGNLSNGLELRFADFGIVANNMSLTNGLHGMFVSITQVDHSRTMVANNVSYSNGGAHDLYLSDSTIPTSNNWMGHKEGNPGFDTEPSAMQFDFTVPGGTSVAAKFQRVRESLLATLAMSANRLVDQGRIVPGVHCERADDAAQPMDPNAACRHWRGAAPDMGPFEDGSIVRPEPPVLLSGSGS